MDEVRVCLCVPSPNIVSLRFCDWNSHSARVDSMPPRWSSNGMVMVTVANKCQS